MSDRPQGLVQRAVERIQTQQSDSAPAAQIEIPLPNLVGISPPLPTADFAARGAADQPFARPSTILWGALAFGFIGLMLLAGTYAVPPPPEREAAAHRPSPSAASTSAAPTKPASPQGDDLIVLGNGLLSTGDIISARLYFERAAEIGNGRAARLAGKTYDPAFLSSLGVHGMRGDAEAAARWYKRARDLGDSEGEGAPSPK